MKKAIISLAVCLLFMGTGKSFAESLGIRLHTFEFGPEASFIQYVEPSVMKETGFMISANASYTYHRNVMLKAEGKYGAGLVSYENSGTIDDIPDYMIELRGLGGYDLPISEKTIMTPYIGIGYRYLNDDSGGKVSSTGAAGYERESNYYYSPVGVETLSELEKEWYFSVVMEYDHFWKGRQRSHLGDAVSGLGTLNNDQNEGYGLRGSLKFRKEGPFSFTVEPFIRYWSIEKSEEETVTFSGSILGVGWEPRNHSTEVGLKFFVNY